MVFGAAFRLGLAALARVAGALVDADFLAVAFFGVALAFAVTLAFGATFVFAFVVFVALVLALVVLAVAFGFVVLAAVVFFVTGFRALVRAAAVDFRVVDLTGFLRAVVLAAAGFRAAVDFLAVAALVFDTAFRVTAAFAAVRFAGFAAAARDAFTDFAGAFFGAARPVAGFFARVAVVAMTVVPPLGTRRTNAYTRVHRGDTIPAPARQAGHTAKRREKVAPNRARKLRAKRLVTPTHVAI